MTESFLTVEQTAERLQLAPLTVRRQLQRGALRGVKRGRVWRVPESALSESAPTRSEMVVRDAAGVPVVAGTTLTVAYLAALKRAGNYSPEEVQQQLPQLSLAQIYGALSFYYEHQSEVDTAIAHAANSVQLS